MEDQQTEHDEYEFMPFFERILVVPEEAIKTTKGGVLIPTESQEVPIIGTIISVGHNIFKDSELSKVVKPGAKVMYMKFSGLPISLEGKSYRMLMANDLIGGWKKKRNTTSEVY